MESLRQPGHCHPSGEESRERERRGGAERREEGRKEGRRKWEGDGIKATVKPCTTLLYIRGMNIGECSVNSCFGLLRTSQCSVATG